ncbi:PIH1 family [Dipodascopsis uninucleata]
MEGEIHLNPQPGFTIKTALVAPTRSPRRNQGQKVFINVCHDKQVPEPADGYGPEVVQRIASGGDWVIPIVVSDERTDTDKSGSTCYTYDCCANTKVLRAALHDSDIRLLLIETCIELVEDRGSLLLSREYKLPKLRSKGELQKTVLRPETLIAEKTEKVGNGLVATLEDMASSVTKPRPGDDIMENKTNSGTLLEKSEIDQPSLRNFKGLPADESQILKTIVKRPLIEEISENKSSDLENISTIWSRSKINLIDLGRTEFPRYRIIVQDGNLESLSKAKVILDMNSRAFDFVYEDAKDSLSIKIPPSCTKIEETEAFYVGREKKLYVFF